PLDALSSTSSGDPLIGDSSFRHWHLAFTCSSRWLPRLHWGCPSPSLDERVREETLLRPRTFAKASCEPCVIWRGGGGFADRRSRSRSLRPPRRPGAPALSRRARRAGRAQ